MEEAREHRIWCATYTSNVYIAGKGGWVAGLSHFWSLAVEEQFYLLWPMIVLFLPLRWLTDLSVVPIALAFIARGVTFAISGEVAAMVLLETRMDALIIGGLMAQWFRAPWSARALAAAGARGIVAIGLTHPIGSSALKSTINELAWVLVCAWIVHAAARGFRGLAGAALTTPASTWFYA